MTNDVFRGLGVKIKLKKNEDFLKIKETLTRIGYASNKSNKLFQSCHILHKRGEYAIIHFKELFVLDGKKSEIDENDIARRNTIASLLEEWNLLDIIPGQNIDQKVELNQIKIISHADKAKWNLVSKYNIGGK